MGLLNIIRRMALREKQSIREISRRTGLSRNTIAKYLSAARSNRRSRCRNDRASLILLPTSWRAG